MLKDMMHLYNSGTSSIQPLFCFNLLICGVKGTFHLSRTRGSSCKLCVDLPNIICNTMRKSSRIPERERNHTKCIKKYIIAVAPKITTPDYCRMVRSLDLEAHLDNSQENDASHKRPHSSIFKNKNRARYQKRTLKRCDMIQIEDVRLMQRREQSMNNCCNT